MAAENYQKTLRLAPIVCMLFGFLSMIGCTGPNAPHKSFWHDLVSGFPRMTGHIAKTVGGPTNQDEAIVFVPRAWLGDPIPMDHDGTMDSNLLRIAYQDHVPQSPLANGNGAPSIANHEQTATLSYTQPVRFPGGQKEQRSISSLFGRFGAGNWRAFWQPQTQWPPSAEACPCP